VPVLTSLSDDLSEAALSELGGLVRLAKKLGVELHQSYRRVGKFALIKY